MKSYNLLDYFCTHTVATPDNPALFVGGKMYSYRDLAKQANSIADRLQAEVKEVSPRIGIWADRTLAAYTGILGTLWAGATYVPLNPNFPRNRLDEIVKQAELSAVIVANSNSSMFDEKISPIYPPVIRVPDNIENSMEAGHSFRLAKPVPPDSHAYLMFTSGTTGSPKGIPVTVGNVKQFVEAMHDRYKLDVDDRLPQYHDLTFDITVIDLFMTWRAGACLYIVPSDKLMSPVSFIREHELTVWSSVPSLIGLLSKLKLLQPGCLPSLRFSMFAGESFSQFDAEMWQQAAPQSVVDNLYGPTEATVICAVHRYIESGDATPERGILPIGEPLPAMSFAVVNEAGGFLRDNQEGELVISGPQVTPGYWRNPALTEARYRLISQPDIGPQRWYFTGDKSYRDSAGVYHFLGRLDNQAKIGGHRIELEEIEFHIRKITGGGDVVAMILPDGGGENLNLVVVSNQNNLDPQTIKRFLRERLPAYMIPHRILFVDNLLRNQNGKIDRNATAKLLQESSAPSP